MAMVMGSGSQGKPRSEGGIWHSLNLMRNRTMQTTGTRGPSRMNSKCQSPGAGKCEKQLGGHRMNGEENGRGMKSDRW